MRRLAFAGSLALLCACTAGETKTADTSTAPPAALSPYIAGVWNVNLKPEGKDTVVTTFVLNTTDSAEWLFQFPKGKPIPMHITSLKGDTVMADTDWFESAVRPGLKARTNSRIWINDDGKLIGRLVTHYQTTGADSVLMFESEGTRKQ